MERNTSDSKHNYQIGSCNNTTTGIGDYEEYSFSIYPNPVNSYLYIDNLDIGSKITIYNLNGVELISQISESSRESINVNSLLKGVYILKASDGNKIKLERFVKF